MKKLTIVYTVNDDETKSLTMTAAAFDSAGSKAPVTRVAVTLTTGEVEPPKRREGESDEDYAARCATILPDRLQVGEEYFTGVAAHCANVLAGVNDVLGHYADREKMVHALAARGKAPPGVKVIKAGGTLGAIGGADVKKA